MVMWLFFFNDTATTEIYTLSLHDALPIFLLGRELVQAVEVNLGLRGDGLLGRRGHDVAALTLDLLACEFRLPLVAFAALARSEEHTSELQSRQYLVCRLLLEKKNNTYFSV